VKNGGWGRVGGEGWWRNLGREGWMEDGRWRRVVEKGGGEG